MVIESSVNEWKNAGGAERRAVSHTRTLRVTSRVSARPDQFLICTVGYEHSSKARCKEGYEAMENEVLNTETHNKYQATSNKYTPARANSHPIRRFTYLQYVIESHDLHAQQTQKTHGWNFPIQESTFPGSK